MSPVCRITDVDAKDLDGFTVLHHAARNGHLDVVLTLLDMGADVAVQNNDGDMPAHDAAQGGHKRYGIQLLSRYFRSFLKGGLKYEYLWSALPSVR